MISLAVTGGIGSGKSTVCSTFRRMRVPVLSADDLSKRIANTDAGVRRKIVALIGPDAYGRSGRLDRAFVAGKVFSRPSLRTKLEAILHPAVLRSVNAWLRSHRSRKSSVVAVEAALVFESGLDRLVDLVVVVDAPVALRTRRIVARDTVTTAQVKKRMAAQMSDGARRRRADVVLSNTSTKKALALRARFLIQVLRKVSL